MLVCLCTFDFVCMKVFTCFICFTFQQEYLILTYNKIVHVSWYWIFFLLLAVMEHLYKAASFHIMSNQLVILRPLFGASSSQLVYLTRFISTQANAVASSALFSSILSLSKNPPLLPLILLFVCNKSYLLFQVIRNII